MEARADEPPIERTLADASFERAILELDAADRRGAWIHLALGLLWMFSLSLGRAADSIAFVALLVVSTARLPWSAPVLRAALRFSWPLALATALGLLVWASGLWSGIEVRDALQPPRWLLVPFMLLPLARSWRMLLGALVAGACLQSAWVVLEAVFVFGRIRYGDPLGLSENPLTFLGLISTGALVSSGLWIAGRGRSALAHLAAALACLTALVCLANRTATLGCLAGLVALLVAGWLVRAASLRRLAALAAGAAIVLSLAGGTLADRLMPTEAGRERAIARGERPTLEAAPQAAELGGATAPEGTPGRAADAGEPALDDDRAKAAEARDGRKTRTLDELLSQYTSSRWILWRETAPAFLDAPILGHGRDGWDAVWKQAFGELPKRGAHRALKPLNSAHNAFLQAAIDQGVVGLSLLVATLLAVFRAARRGLPSARELVVVGLVASWSAGALSSSALNISAGWMPFAAMVWLASWTGLFQRERA